MQDTIAVLDACVLYPAPLRDAFMHLAVADTFRACWTDRIHDEWIRNLLANREDLTIEQLTRTRKLMDSNVRDCLVQDYESLIESLELPDVDDRHVLAAAIKVKADLIITFNLKDFPNEYVGNYGIEAIHPDVFITSLIESIPEKVQLAFTRQHENLKHPPYTLDEFLETLNNNGLFETVKRLREMMK